MKCLVFATPLICAGFFHNVAHAEDAPPFECFSSAEAVLEAHPGSHAFYTAHATWWTESSICWHVGKSIAKPAMTTPQATAMVASAPAPHIAEALAFQPRQEAPETYEEVTASLRAMMFGPDEFPASLNARLSSIGNTRAFSSSR
jgi:hypothetical protein